MTTIAWDGRTLAADRLVTCSGMKIRGRKIWRCGAYVFGGAGSVPDLQVIQRWLAAGAKPTDAPTLEDGGCWGIAVRLSDARGFSIQGRHVELVSTRAPRADGSGRDYATAAMYLGKTAREAVAVAARFEANTGMGVDSFDVRPR